MDGRLNQREEQSLDALAETLGCDPLPRDMDGGPELAESLTLLGQRARGLLASERRSRQASAAYRAASLALSRSPDSGTLLEELLDYLGWIVAYDAAQVLIASPGGALRSRALREWRLVPRRLADREIEALVRRANGRVLLEERDEERLLCVPLSVPGGLLGAVLLSRAPDEESGATPRPYDEEEVRAAEAFAGQAAAALQNASLFEDLRRADSELLVSYDTSIEILSKTLDLRDHETEGHSLRVATAAEALAKDVSLPGDEILRLRRGALLHDIGKIGIPDAILLKPGSLTEDETSVMRMHPVYARELLEGIPFLRKVIDVPWCHHERWDGSGYPRGISGEEIPLSARIFSVADVWDALTHDRPYRRSLGQAEAITIIRSGTGTQFDPSIVEIFLRLFR